MAQTNRSAPRRRSSGRVRPRPLGVVRFTVPGDPLSWARTGKNGKRHFTKEPQKSHMEAIQLCYRSAGMAKFPAEMPLVMSCRFWFRRPPEHFSKVDGALKPWAGLEWPAGRQRDLSNLMKIVEDALNKIAYHDDIQIVRYQPYPERVYLPGQRDKPRTDVLIAPFPGWKPKAER